MRPCDYLFKNASAEPDRLALKDATTSFSYAQAARYVQAVANALARDFAPGTHIAIYSPNDCRVSLLQLASNAAGMAWISIHPANPVEANARILKELDCDVVFIHSRFEHAIPTLRAAGGIDRFIAIDEPIGGLLTTEQWSAGCESLAAGPVAGLDAVAMLQPTGGTTGEPKGVIHTNGSLEASVLAFRHEDPSLHNSRMLVVAPLTHGAGLWAIAGLAASSTIIIHQSFDVAAVLEAIQAERITSIFVPPTALYAILDHPAFDSYDLTSLSTILLGAAPTSPARFVEAVQRFGPIVYEVFGQTETLAPITCKRPADYMRLDGSLDEAVLGSVGRAVPNAWLEILTDDDRFASQGERGEIIVRSTMVMAGYYKNQEETERASWNGWHRTGDVGFKDAAGFVYIVDRKRDMIISGGFNVYPSQIERVIGSHPDVHDVVVVGVPDPKWGEAVKAVVQLKSGRTVDPAALVLLCQEQLGSVNCPKSIEFWDDLPRSSIGKLLRREVRSVFWDGHHRTI